MLGLPGVVIGGRSGHASVPIIGDDVVLSAGCKILGPITIGAGSIIGANSVVIHDVPENSIVVGIPGRILRSDGMASEPSQD